MLHRFFFFFFPDTWKALSSTAHLLCCCTLLEVACGPEPQHGPAVLPAQPQLHGAAEQMTKREIFCVMQSAGCGKKGQNLRKKKESLENELRTMNVDKSRSKSPLSIIPPAAYFIPRTRDSYL